MTASLKQVLVHLDPSIGAAQRLALARQIAGQHGAAVTALYATTPVFVGLPYSPELAPTMAASLIEIDNERRARTRKMFEESLLAPGVPANWSETPDLPVVGAFAQQALHADLIVLGQRDPTDVLTAGGGWRTFPNRWCSPAAAWRWSYLTSVARRASVRPW